MIRTLKKLAGDNLGATAVEYAIIASVISVAALGAYMAVGEQSNENMKTVASKYSGAQ